MEHHKVHPCSHAKKRVTTLFHIWGKPQLFDTTLLRWTALNPAPQKLVCLAFQDCPPSSPRSWSGKQYVVTMMLGHGAGR